MHGWFTFMKLLKSILYLIIFDFMAFYLKRFEMKFSSVRLPSKEYNHLSFWLSILYITNEGSCCSTMLVYKNSTSIDM